MLQELSIPEAEPTGGESVAVAEEHQVEVEDTNDNVKVPIIFVGVFEQLY